MDACLPSQSLSHLSLVRQCTAWPCRCACAATAWRGSKYRASRTQVLQHCRMCLEVVRGRRIVVGEECCTSAINNLAAALRPQPETSSAPADAAWQRQRQRQPPARGSAAAGARCCSCGGVASRGATHVFPENQRLRAHTELPRSGVRDAAGPGVIMPLSTRLVT